MLPTRLDFAEIRRRARFESVLDHYGLRLIRTGMQQFILCPFHRETTPSCSIHLAKRIFHCFGCGAKGTIIDFVAMMERINFRAAAAKLDAICGDEVDKSCNKEPMQSDRCTECRNLDMPNPPLGHTLSLDPTHPYLKGRGIPSEIVDEFGIGYCSRGPMRGRICIPIHDAKGNLVAYAGRWAGDAIPNGIPRYVLSTGFRRRYVLFNLNRIGHNSHIVLVEGYWSVFRLRSLGIPVVGLMGSEISLQQMALLAARNIQFVTVLMDGDRAGRSGRAKITPLLAQQFSVFAPLLPIGQKPDAMSEAHLAALKTLP